MTVMFVDASGGLLQRTGGARPAAKTNCVVSENGFCLTLPGHISQARRGDREINVTRDLRPFLCSAASIAASASRSSAVLLDWTLTAPEQDYWIEGQTATRYMLPLPYD